MDSIPYIRIVSAVTLLIMAVTWSVISIRLGVMVAVSPEYLYVGGVLLAAVSGESLREHLTKRGPQ